MENLDNDIYNNKKTYLELLKDPEKLLKEPNRSVGKNRKYYLKNKENLKYFYKLVQYFDSKNLSFVRRLRLIRNFKLLCFATEKDLKDVDRDEVQKILAYMHSAYSSSNTKSDFIKDIKYLWKILLPEKDHYGRDDDTLVPYVVRNLSSKVDVSRKKLRNDKLTPEEFERIINYFNKDIRMQAYLMVAFESLGRPQELLWRRIKDVDSFDDYAKIWISDHGKEGTGFLQVIDSYPYLVNWLNVHPDKKNPDAFLFLNNYAKKNGFSQLKPMNINKHLKKACETLGIKKNITCYSIKRNGVTFRRLRGDDDATIQHVARWTSTKQLRAYDLSEHDDTFRRELIKRGVIKPGDENEMKYKPEFKKCLICSHNNPFTNVNCANCKRPLDREKITKDQEEKDKRLQNIEKQLEVLIDSGKAKDLINRY